MESTERNSPAVVNANGTMFHIKAENLYETYLRDQIDPNRSVTDLHLSCEDGHVPVHRYLLMGTSTFIKEVLNELDPSELAVIHLPDVKLRHVVQVLSLVYTGKTVINKDDQIPVFSAMKMLGISTRYFEFRASKPTDNASIPKLRFYRNHKGEMDYEMELMAQTYVDLSMINGVHRGQHTPASSTSTNPEVEHERSEVSGDSGPKVSSKSRIDKAESQRLLKLKVELPEDDTYKCYPCEHCFPSMESLLHHLSEQCAARLNSKYLFDCRQCLVCLRKFPSFNIWGLLRHVNECKGRLRLVPAPVAPTVASGIEECAHVQSENEASECLDSDSIVIVNGVDSMDEEVVMLKKNLPIKDVVAGVRKSTIREEGPIGVVEVETVESVHPDIDGASTSLCNGIALNVRTKKRRRKRGLTKTVKRRRTRQNGTDQDEEEHAMSAEERENEVQEATLDPCNEEVGAIRILGLDSLTDKDADNFSDEMDSDAKINPLFVCEVGEQAYPVSSGNKQVSDIDPNLVRSELEINSTFDISNLSRGELRNLFRQCPLCKSTYDKLKYVSKCLRQHGYRYCWVCLKLLPYKGLEFDDHNQTQHCHTGNADRVNCPLCSKEFEYKLALPTHLGNFHCLRIQDPSSDNEESTTCVAEEVNIDEPKIAYRSHSKKNYPNSLNVSSGDAEAKGSKLRDILTGPFASALAANNRSRRSSRRGSAENDRDGRLIVKLGEKLAKYKGAQDKISTKEIRMSSEEQKGKCPTTSPKSEDKDEKEVSSSSPKETAKSKPEPTQPPASSARMFLYQQVIDGHTYDVYCFSADPKKTIAIPVAPTESN